VRAALIIAIFPSVGVTKEIVNAYVAKKNHSAVNIFSARRELVAFYCLVLWSVSPAPLPANAIANAVAAR
jgi:hypothetical protein